MSPLGAAPVRVVEPSPVDRSTPRALVAALAAALEERDAAALARLRAGTHEKPVLDQHDLDRARLDFLAHGLDAHWKRVVAAVDPARLDRISGATGPTAVSVDVGGALGSVSLRFENTQDGWVLR